MKHVAVPSFWELYNKLPADIKLIADKNFQLLKQNSNHPSLHLKKVNEYWSVRIGQKYRALGIQTSETIVWYWIGKHNDYDNLIG
jgi:hypothetical protein